MPIYTMLIAVVLKTALLLAAAVLVCRLLASRSSACRHLLWTLTLALSLVMPFAAVMLRGRSRHSYPRRARSPPY